MNNRIILAFFSVILLFNTQFSFAFNDNVSLLVYLEKVEEVAAGKGYESEGFQAAVVDEGEATDEVTMVKGYEGEFFQAVDECEATVKKYKLALRLINIGSEKVEIEKVWGASEPSGFEVTKALFKSRVLKKGKSCTIDVEVSIDKENDPNLAPINIDYNVGGNYEGLSLELLLDGQFLGEGDIKCFFDYIENSRAQFVIKNVSGGFVEIKNVSFYGSDNVEKDLALQLEDVLAHGKEGQVGFCYKDKSDIYQGCMVVDYVVDGVSKRSVIFIDKVNKNTFWGHHRVITRTLQAGVVVGVIGAGWFVATTVTTAATAEALRAGIQGLLEDPPSRRAVTNQARGILGDLIKK
jgi:hypothetical protein